MDYFDLWTYSFPCQDLSQAGKQAGIKEGTRSGLLYEVERLLEDSVNKGTQPKYLLLENVKALVSKKFMPDFQRWLDKLEQLGYNNYWQVLNAKDYGIPQNRERVFVVSIRKDIDTQGYSFPEKQKLELRLKDMLESNVDEKYYLSEEKVSKLVNSGFNQERARIQSKDCCDTLLARDYKDPKCIAELKDKEVSNTIRCGGSGSLDGKHTWDIVVEPMAYDEQNGYVRKDGCVGTLTTDGSSPKHNNRVIEPLCAASRGRNPDNPSDRTVGSPTEQRLEIKYDGCTNTLTTVQKDNYVIEPSGLYIHDSERFHNAPLEGLSRCIKAEKYNGNNYSYKADDNEGKKILEKLKEYGVNTYQQLLYLLEEAGYAVFTDTQEDTSYRVRKLTPRECWRLMGVKDEQYDLLHGISNTQLYKLAGNSIVVNVLEGIFRNLLLPSKEKSIPKDIIEYMQRK